MGGVQSILETTRLTLEPLSVIRLYSYQFRIGRAFRERKRRIGAFSYHFWSKRMPKLGYYQKKDDPTPLERVKSEKSRKKVLETVRIIEMHMALSSIAMGILQSFSIRSIGKVNSSQLRYQRTPSKGRVSEAAIYATCENIFSVF